jgi:spermidine/putrescine transport system permease protein
MRSRAALLLAPSVVWLGLFLVVPLLATLWISFLESRLGVIVWNFTFDNFVRLATRPVYAILVLKSLRIALTVTVITLIIAYPIAYWITTLTPARKAQVVLLILIPFWISYVVRTYAWFPMLGTGGIINWALQRTSIIDQPLDVLLFNEFTVHIGLLYVYLPYAIIPIALSIDRIDRSLIEAARDLGAGTTRVFMKVVLPLSMPGVLAASIMVFILCFGAYVTPALLGGTSGIMIGRVIPDLLGAGMNWPLGAALATLMMLITVLWIWLIGARIGLERIFVGEK